MISRLLRRGGLLAAAAALAGCGGAGTASPSGSTPTSTAIAAQAAATTVPAAQPAATPSVAVRTARGYGRLLVDGEGRTLYLFTADKRRASVCRAACAVAWPPLIVKGAPRAGPGVGGSRLSAVRRADGHLQLAYFGHPLYRYIGDRQPGQINCQDAEEFGGHWWLVAPGGQPNRATP